MTKERMVGVISFPDRQAAATANKRTEFGTVMQ
jgi:hypothetical protein